MNRSGHGPVVTAQDFVGSHRGENRCVEGTGGGLTEK